MRKMANSIRGPGAAGPRVLRLPVPILISRLLSPCRGSGSR